MPRTQQLKQVNNFIGGLNTEASPLNFPEGTAKDLDNVDLHRNGSIRRRFGIDYESGGAYSDPTFAEATFQLQAITTGNWTSVDGNDDLNFLVIQVGTVLYFHNLGKTELSTAVIGSIDLDPWKTNDDMGEYPMDFVPAKGKLFVVNKYMSPVYLSYDADTDSFSASKITVKIRDLDGISEDAADSPTTTSDDIPTDPYYDWNDVLDILDNIDDIPMTEISAPGAAY